MNLISRTGRIGLVAAGTALILAGVVGCTSNGKSGAGSVVAGSATTTTAVDVGARDGGNSASTTTAAPGGDAPAASGAGPTTVPPRASATTKAATSPSTAAGRLPTTAPGTKPPGPLVVPKLGSYPYRATSTTPDGKTTTTDTNVVVKAGAPASGGMTNLVVTIPSDFATITSDTGWSSAGVIARSSTITAMGITFDCDWNPDFAEYLAPLRAGLTWKIDTRCATTIAGQPTTIHLVQDSTVVGGSSATVATTNLPTWQIKRSLVIDVNSAAFNQTVHSTSTEEFSPDYGIVISQEGDSDGGGQAQHSTLHLLSLTPA